MNLFTGANIAKKVQAENFIIVKDAKISVHDRLTGSLANLYEDNDGLIDKAQPFNADDSGSFLFYIKDGQYKITCEKGSAKSVYFFNAHDGDNTAIKSFLTINDALSSYSISSNDLIHIKETLTNDDRLSFWQVLLTNDVTVNDYNIRQSAELPELSIKLQGFDFVKRDREKKLKYIAHRGIEFEGVDNTMQAFSSCADYNIDGFETDVQISYDDIIYLFHDSNLAGITNHSGSIQASTSAYIETAIFDENLGTAYEDQRITRLEDLLIFANKKGIDIYPELKWYSWDDNSKIDLLLDLLDQYNFLNERCTLMAYDISFLQYIRSKNSDVGVAWVEYTEYDTVLPDLQILASLGKATLTYAASLLIEDNRFMEFCNSSGVKVIGYTIYDQQEADELKSIGCYGVMAKTILGSMV